MTLIINGDDFALNESCSRAIAEAFGKGLITSTTMMATGEYFEEAVKLAREKGFTDRIGVHFNLTEGRPLTEDIRNVPAFVRDGCFHKDYLKAPRALTESEKSAVFGELCAQAERLKKAGIPLIRADSHHYIHNLIYIAPLAAEVCKRFEIHSVRISRTFSDGKNNMKPGVLTENSWWREQGFSTTSRFGRMSDVYGKAIPDDLEIMVHPDFDRNGDLIDRRGVSDGYPTGEKLVGSSYFYA